MKKFISIFLLLLSSYSSYCQLDKIDAYEYYRNKSVINYGKSIGSLDYTSEGYVLYGVSNNIFEATYHSIFLGSTKRSAILSLEELRDLDTKKAYITKGELEFNTIIYSSDGTRKSTVIMTEGVLGVSHILAKLSKSSWEKSIHAIDIFQEPKWE